MRTPDKPSNRGQTGVWASDFQRSTHCQRGRRDFKRHFRGLCTKVTAHITLSCRAPARVASPSRQPPVGDWGRQLSDVNPHAQAATVVTRRVLALASAVDLYPKPVGRKILATAPGTVLAVTRPSGADAHHFTHLAPGRRSGSSGGPSTTPTMSPFRFNACNVNGLQFSAQITQAPKCEWTVRRFSSSPS